MVKNCKECPHYIEVDKEWHERVCEISEWERDVGKLECIVSCHICFHDKTCTMSRHGTDDGPFECPRFSPIPEWLFKKENRNELL